MGISRKGMFTAMLGLACYLEWRDCLCFDELLSAQLLMKYTVTAVSAVNLVMNSINTAANSTGSMA